MFFCLSAILMLHFLLIADNDLQITCIRINHDTWPEIYMTLIYILIENVHFYIFEVAYNF